MSTLWTPDGERPIRREAPANPSPPPGPASQTDDAPDEPELTEAEMAAQMEQMRQELAETPVEVVVANHAFGLFQLAALHLSLQPPQLAQARTAIDGFGALVEGMQGRLGDQERELTDALSQLRMAFVQITAAQSQQPPSET